MVADAAGLSRDAIDRNSVRQMKPGMISYSPMVIDLLVHHPRSHKTTDDNTAARRAESCASEQRQYDSRARRPVTEARPGVRLQAEQRYFSGLKAN